MIDYRKSENQSIQNKQSSDFVNSISNDLMQSKVPQEISITNRVSEEQNKLLSKDQSKSNVSIDLMEKYRLMQKYK